MSTFIDQMRARKRIVWDEIEGVKIGFKKLTINETIEYAKRLTDCGDDTDKMASLFAEQCVDENEKQAFKADQIDTIMSEDELEQLVNRFNEINNIGIDPSVTEKNSETTP